MPYSKPPINNLPFKFTSSGYSKPSFGNVPFRFGLRSTTAQTSDLQGAINVMGLYQTSTYTYLKECPTIIVGYGPYGPQILKLPCIYGGIRDLGGYLSALPPNVDLPAYIYAINNYSDLIGYIRTVTTGTKDLPTYVYGIPPEDLPAVLHGWDIKDLQASLGGWAIKDLPVYVYSIPPKDLQAILNVIEIRNLPISITGVWWHGQKDLGAIVFKTSIREYLDLQGVLHGWDTKNLSVYVQAMKYKDLSATISPLRSIDLQAIIYSIAPFDLGANLHGWATSDLIASLIGEYGPGDIQVSIYPIPPVDLNARLHVYKGIEIPFNLKGIIESYCVGDLQANINAISSVDLIAYLNPTGKSADLNASIIPKVIAIKKAIQVALLEHKDLTVMMNFQCFSSAYKDLSAYLYPLMKKDLKSYIIGWYGSTSDNIKDLTAYINAGVYSVQDRVKLDFFASADSQTHYTKLKIKFNVADSYTVFDTLDIHFSTMYRANLTAYIKGILTHIDLPATLTPVVDTNFTTLPPWIIPKTHEVVINLEKLEDQWRRFVEIMFDNAGDTPFHYFYVAGEQKVYRVDRDRHWTIWVKSYIPDDESILDRKNVRSKYKFKLSDYNTIDEAIRDMIDRVTLYPSLNLSAVINGGMPPYKNLTVRIDPLMKYSWSKNLHSFIYGYVNDSRNIDSQINGVYLFDQLDINASLTPIDYDPPEGDALLFNFEDGGYIPPVYDDTDLIWTSDDAE